MENKPILIKQELITFQISISFYSQFR